MTVHDYSPEIYHSDTVAAQPSLSASIAKILISSSPRHAWTAHPRLNPDFQRVEAEKFDIGTCAHALLLEGDARIEVVPFDDWRTNAAKELRDAARAAGKIPLLDRNAADVVAMVAAAKVQLGEHEARPALFTDGLPERTLVWDESGVTCRARLDWLRNDYSCIDDYKTTSRSANPESWVRSSLFSHGFDVQAAFYLRGVSALEGAPLTRLAEFRFCVQEIQPPYALSVVTLGPDVLALANEKVQYAIDLWRGCLLNDDWPAYTRFTATAELPAWQEAAWMEKQGLEREAA